MIVLSFALIFGGWALAAALALFLGHRTDFSLAALVFALGVGTACNIAGVMIS